MNRFLILTSVCVLLGAGCQSTPVIAPVPATEPAPVTSTTTQSKPAAVATTPTATTTVPPVSVGVAADSALETLSVTMTSGNFFFDPVSLTASPGQSVSISFSENEGVHTFVIDEIGLKKTISTGGVVTFAAPTVPGSYAYYCDVGAHRKLGMEGVLIVK